MSGLGELNDESAEENDVDASDDPAVVIEDQDTYSKVPDALTFDVTVSHLACRIFAVLYSHGIKPQRCFPSKRRIAKLIGISERSVDRPLMELMERGWVRRFPRRAKGGTGIRVANGYALALDPARARANAEKFERGAEPEPLRRGRLAALTSAQVNADANPEPVHANVRGRPRTFARAVRATQRGELDQEELDQEELQNARGELELGSVAEPVVASDGARVEPPDPAPLPSEPETETRARETVGTDSEHGTLFGSEPAGSTADAVAESSAAGLKRKKDKARPAGEHDPDFVRFWKMSLSWAPHHDSRAEAYKAWGKVRHSGITAGVLLAAWEQATAMWATWPEEHHEYIPAERNWLGRGYWKKPVKPRSGNVRAVRQTCEEADQIMREAAAELAAEQWGAPPREFVEGRIVGELPRRSA